MLNIIGIGLHSPEDMTIRGLKLVQSSDLVYLENYTSVQPTSVSGLEDLVGRKVVLADRELVEASDQIIVNAKSRTVSFLVVGTPMFATTHIDFLTRAREQDVKVQIVHNASIFNVIGCCGLYSYAFGRTISIPYYTDTWKPTSFYGYLADNCKTNLHTLCLLDIRVDEGRFMTANVAMKQLLYCEEQHRKGIISLNTGIFVVCRFGSPHQLVVYNTIGNLIDRDFGDALHTLIIPSSLEIIEKEFVEKHFSEGHGGLR